MTADERLTPVCDSGVSFIAFFTYVLINQTVKVGNNRKEMI